MTKGDGLYNLSLREKLSSFNSGVALVAGAVTITAFVVLWIFLPLLVILALNTLFPLLVIPYNFYTWSATVFLWWVSKRKSSLKFLN